jgi:hypothetical protein
MGFLPLFPSNKPLRPLDPRVEALLRSTPRVEAPEGLRTRLLAAHARGERPAPAVWRPGFAWASSLAAAAVLVAAVPFFNGGETRRQGGVLASAGGLPLRVVDDPTLGLHDDAPIAGQGPFVDAGEAP